MTFRCAMPAYCCFSCCAGSYSWRWYVAPVSVYAGCAAGLHAGGHTADSASGCQRIQCFWSGMLFSCSGWRWLRWQQRYRLLYERFSCGLAGACYYAASMPALRHYFAPVTPAALASFRWCQEASDDMPQLSRDVIFARCHIDDD